MEDIKLLIPPSLNQSKQRRCELKEARSWPLSTPTVTLKPPPSVRPLLLPPPPSTLTHEAHTQIHHFPFSESKPHSTPSYERSTAKPHSPIIPFTLLSPLLNPIPFHPILSLSIPHPNHAPLNHSLMCPPRSSPRVGNIPADRPKPNLEFSSENEPHQPVAAV